MPLVEWKQSARADLWEIVDYISDDNPEAAQRLKDEIEARAGRLPENPQAYRVDGEVSQRDHCVFRCGRI